MLIHNLYCAAIIKYKEEEVYRPPVSSRNYDFDSDESLNRYDHENFCVPPFQPTPNFCQYGSNDHLFQSRQLNQRRHSSYSHEDILNMKYQNPPIDPRYRDSRPFVNSNTSLYDHGRRDFMSRRRSSSSLQEDLLRPFQQIQLDSYLRKSNPVIHNNSSPNLSEKSNSNWNLNPSIYIEEYNDNAAEEVKSTNSSTNISYIEPHQPLNEETVAPFAGCDEIPFIDDENDNSTHFCDIYMPVVNCAEYQRQAISYAEKPLPPYMKNRKTVSFDLVDSNEELNKIRKTNTMNKSNTCDHITNIKLSDLNRTGTKTLYGQTAAREPTFKFCTLKNCNVMNPNETTESFNTHTNLDNDNLSAYFYGDDPDDQQLLGNKENMNQTKSIIDTKSILLDLSELNSDSTSSSQTEPIEIKSKTINPPYVHAPMTKGIDKFAYIPTWKPPKFYEHIAYGNGKVRALKSYFEGLEMPVKCFSESSPDLSKKSDKLTETERQTVLDQLKEWSEYGSSSKITPDSQPRTTKAIQSNPITHSVLNLTVTTSYNDRLAKDDRSSSVPDVNDYELSDEMLLPQPKKKKKYPESSVLRKPKISTNIWTTHKITNSCPNLCRGNQFNDKPYYVSSRLQTNIYSSPCHRSAQQTVRKVKQNQKMGKRAKCCRDGGNCAFANSDAADEAR